MVEMEILRPWLHSGITLAIVIFLRMFCINYIFDVVKKLIYKTPFELDNQIVDAFQGPFKVFILLFGVYIAIIVSPLDTTEAHKIIIHSCMRSVLILCFYWGLFNLTNEKDGIIHKLLAAFGWQADNVLTHLISTTIRISIIGLAFIMLAKEWRYDINGFIAGLGIGGLAFALAAQETLANVFGGVVIIVDKPFRIGDWVETPAGEGIVEEVSFRSTKIRNFTQGVIDIPNSTLSKAAVTNWSKRTKRRVRFTIGLTYSSTAEQMQECIKLIHEAINAHPDIVVEDTIVTFDNYGASSLDILVNYFCVHTDFPRYAQVKQELNFKIMQIVNDLGLGFAFPSTSLYFETPIKQEAPSVDTSAQKAKI